MVEPELTADTLFDGDLVLMQEKKGYRFSVDSVLLAHFVAAEGADSLLDLGCGCGVMPLVLARRHPGLTTLVGVELQVPLARLAERNVMENGASDRATIHRADIRQCREPYPGGPFDLVISNPPYTPLGRGRLNPLDQKAIARHEVSLSLSQLLDAAALNLSPTGTFHLVYPADRCEEVLAAAQQKKLYPRRLRMVCSHAGAPPKRLLLSFGRTPAPLLTLPPLTVHENDGSMTDEVDKMFKK
ncbi:tRNA1(Val) (adenine(37)-N6)-methyltransferase [Desulfoluna spongiiphila]|uniref:tRNA1(Val) (adenine(37)-N6)-methyltransferase n=1 Tax=Desulfoluna spongiiphila TaxID=419481 RepID=UPI0012566A02|nr:methyltransferase [Desulfoluna spongiiphila]VVS92084.1 s-adenosyl-l-methionine-dependent methyltransferase [Desulfoluna spongiiphila]